VVLFDEDGAAALESARRLQAAGHPRVRALFGGLALWDFSLDPQVVGEETYLVRGA
jgi:3-mercaptopyruvate sulfurtransferase SseA